MANFFKGDEVKFAIDLTAPGFSMDADDFDLEVKTPKGGVKASKAAPTEQLRIFKETTTIPPAEEGGEETTVNTWYAIVDTSVLEPGEMTVVAGALIVDANANDGIRRQSATAKLGTLKLS